VKISWDNYLKPAAWHDAMTAALESSSAYATTAIALYEKPRAKPNLTTLMTHVKSADLRQITERRLSSSQPKSDELLFKWTSINPVDCTNAAYHVR
jgi:hypothetical protein